MVHAIPCVIALKARTTLQKNKHCSTIKMMSKNIRDYHYRSSLASVISLK